MINELFTDESVLNGVIHNYFGDSTEYMFKYCNSLLVFPTLNMNGISRASYMFEHCSSDVEDIAFYNIGTLSTQYMFYFYDYIGDKACGTIELNGSPGVIQNPSAMFWGCKATKILFNDLYVDGSCWSMFKYCRKLTTISGLNLKGASNSGNVFQSCSSLVDCEIKNINVPLSFADSPLLSSDSLEHIVNNLVNKSADTQQTLTLHIDSWAKVKELEDTYLITADGFTGLTKDTDMFVQTYTLDEYLALKNWKIVVDNAWEVTTNLTNVSHSGDRFVKKGEAYTSTITVDDGYELDTITITMGGTDVTSTVWNAETNTISISAVTGDVAITAATKTFYTVSYTLTNVTCNGASQVERGSTYTATLIADEGYEIDDVSAMMMEYGPYGSFEWELFDIWNAETNTISISGVTGDVVIIATAKKLQYVLTHNWDFTTSLTDTVSGVTATFAGTNAETITQDSNGVSFTDAAQAIQLTSEASSLANKRVEIDIASGSFTAPTSQHARLFGIGPSAAIHEDGACFGWRYNTDPGWTLYQRPGMTWATSLDTEQYPIDFFNGKTVRLDFDADCYLTLSYATIGSSDFTTIRTYQTSMTTSEFTGVYVIGSSLNNELYPATFSGVRVYEWTSSYYTVTYDLESPLTCDGPAEVGIGEAFTAKINIDVDNYYNWSIESVTITMGGIDVTDSAWVKSTPSNINIESVTGNIVITATAEKGTPDDEL